MKCPCSYMPLLLTIIVIVFFITYFRCRKDSCIFSRFKHIHPSIFSIYDVNYPYKLPSLPFAYNALEPYIDAETLTIHHTKHHQSYIDNLNKALEAHPEFKTYTLETLLTNLNTLPADIRDKVRNNGGGHFNHMLFWNTLSPQGGLEPETSLLAEINKNFGSFQSFKEQFEKIALGHVGSGWIWLCLTPSKKLTIIATLNHDTPMAQGLYPLLVLDIWEHAYYLKYRNKRADFVTGWWNIINWKFVKKLYSDGLKALS